MKQLLVSVNDANRKQTIQTLSGWVAWYRDILDEELIATWRQDSRANLPEVIQALSDERVASGIISFSWRESRQNTFNLTYAPLLTSLMSRYPKSAEPFLRDLLGQPPALSQGEAEAVCRILIDMPDLGTWRESALQILPHYTEAAKELLAQDLHSTNEDKLYRAEMWMSDLKITSPTVAARQQSRPRNMPSESTSDARLDPPRRLHVDGPYVPIETEPRSARAVLPPVPVPVPVPQTAIPQPPAPQPASPQPTVPQTAVPQNAPPPVKPTYDGPKSGIYESTGSPIPQSAEYVFRNVPLVQLRLEYDVKIWEARLVPVDGKTQRLIVKNKSTSPQKHCVVRWTLVP